MKFEKELIGIKKYKKVGDRSILLSKQINLDLGIDQNNIKKIYDDSGNLLRVISKNNIIDIINDEDGKISTIHVYENNMHKYTINYEYKYEDTTNIYRAYMYRIYKKFQNCVVKEEDDSDYSLIGCVLDVNLNDTDNGSFLLDLLSFYTGNPNSDYHKCNILEYDKLKRPVRIRYDEIYLICEYPNENNSLYKYVPTLVHRFKEDIYTYTLKPSVINIQTDDYYNKINVFKICLSCLKDTSIYMFKQKND